MTAGFDGVPRGTPQGVPYDSGGLAGALLLETREAFDDVADPGAVIEARAHRLAVFAVVDDVDAEVRLAMDDVLNSAPQPKPVRFFRLKAEATCLGRNAARFCQLRVEGEEVVGPGQRSRVGGQDSRFAAPQTTLRRGGSKTFRSESRASRYRSADDSQPPGS